PRGLAQRLAPLARLVGIHVADRDAHPTELLVEQRARAAIDPLRGNQVISGPQNGKMRQRSRRVAAAETDAALGALECGIATTDFELVGVVAVASVEDLALDTGGIAEGAALVDRGDGWRAILAAADRAVNRQGGTS